MDDFLTGPHSFTLDIDSSDSPNIRKPHGSIIGIALAKPLEFISGNWEVCLKQMICIPRNQNHKDILVSGDANNRYKFFRVLTDFTAPVSYGSTYLPIIGMGVLKHDKSGEILSCDFSNDTYIPVIKSYISKLNISIIDCNGILFPFHSLTSLIVLKLHFRLKTVI